jgi:cystathionine gamma-lyase
MAAHVTVANLLKNGDHVLCVDDVYGGTQRYLLKILQVNANIDVTLSDFSNIAEFKK